MERKPEVQKGAWYHKEEEYVDYKEFKEDEIDLIMRLHKLLGNKWSLIAGRLPGRTANDVENYWNLHLIKRPEFQLPILRHIEVARPQAYFFKENGLLVPDQPPQQYEEQDDAVTTPQSDDTVDSTVQNGKDESSIDQHTLTKGI